MGNFAENLDLGNRFRPPCKKRGENWEGKEQHQVEKKNIKKVV